MDGEEIEEDECIVVVCIERSFIPSSSSFLLFSFFFFSFSSFLAHFMNDLSASYKANLVLHTLINDSSNAVSSPYLHGAG